MGKGRPGGNPDIRTILKTGPKTFEGKLKGVLAQPHITINSKLVSKVRRCDKCPLGPYDKSIKTKDGYRSVVMPATCKFWIKDRETCEIKPTEHLLRLKKFFELQRNNNLTEAVVEQVMMSALIDAEATREFETLKKGHPAGYTQMHRDMTVKSAEILGKMKYGEKHQNLNININADLVLERIKNFKEEEKNETD